MSKILLHPTYLPSISTFAVLVQRNIIWEAHDNFQKQTYRNRCHICTDQGKHMLNIPIKHVGGAEGRQKYADVEIDYSSNWPKQHWRTLETAYRTSPYFEFYEDDIRPLFEQPLTSLYQFNLKSIGVILDCLGEKLESEATEKYEPTPEKCTDGRFLVEAKKPIPLELDSYDQVFGERHGFIPDLSIVDLIFNEGPNSISYLKNLSITIPDA
nr:WbqC family protein [Allomuricauda sp.]